MTEPSVPDSLFVRVLTILDHGLANPRVALRQLVKSLALVGVGALGGAAIAAASSEAEPKRGWTYSEWPRSHDAVGLAWAIAEFQASEGRCPSSLDELVEQGTVGRVTAVNAWGEPLRWKCEADWVIAYDAGNPDMRWDEYAATVRPQDHRHVDPDHPIPFFLRMDPSDP